MPAANEGDGDRDARGDERDVSRATHCEQIWIVLVRRSESQRERGQPEQDETDTT
ncbi:hypothetical protein [Bradyrhizobium sp. CB82]|uniref:hypothetical protein n=1 Tax=Bradyrhizobium sp. CB82 TaxID=3039159 RepID=UPI0032C22810